MRFVTKIDDNNELTIVIVKDTCDPLDWSEASLIPYSDLKNVNIPKISNEKFIKAYFKKKFQAFCKFLKKCPAIWLLTN